MLKFFFSFLSSRMPRLIVSRFSSWFFELNLRALVDLQNQVNDMQTTNDVDFYTANETEKYIQRASEVVHKSQLDVSIANNEVNVFHRLNWIDSDIQQRMEKKRSSIGFRCFSKWKLTFIFNGDKCVRWKRERLFCKLHEKASFFRLSKKHIASFLYCNENRLQERKMKPKTFRFFFFVIFRSLPIFISLGAAVSWNSAQRQTLTF